MDGASFAEFIHDEMLAPVYMALYDAREEIMEKSREYWADHSQSFFVPYEMEDFCRYITYHVMLNIPEPPAENEAAAPGELDLAVVPCVTTTTAGARLGYGGGCYDRFLRLHRCPTMCLCYGRILADELPTDENDVRMDVVVTENGAI